MQIFGPIFAEMCIFSAQTLSSWWKNTSKVDKMVSVRLMNISKYGKRNSVFLKEWRRVLRLIPLPPLSYFFILLANSTSLSQWHSFQWPLGLFGYDYILENYVQTFSSPLNICHPTWGRDVGQKYNKDWGLSVKECINPSIDWFSKGETRIDLGEEICTTCNFLRTLNR